MGTDAINNIFGTPSQETPSGGGDAGGGTGGDVGPWRPLLNLIASKESGGNYEAMAPMKTLPGATKMTIAEVARKATGAVGKYQQLPQYLIKRAKAAGLDPDKDLFSPANQDSIAAKVNIGMNRGGNSWLAGKMKTEDFMQGLSQEFAVMPNAYGKFYYPKQSSSMTPQQVKAALEQVKKGGESSSTTAKSRTPQAPTGTPQASTGSNPPGALAPGQRPDRALTSEQFKTAQQAREEGKSQGLTGQALERSVANAVMGTSGATSATGAAIGEPTREIKVSSADLPSPKDMEIASAQPEMKPMDTSSIVPFDTQQVASGGYSQAPRNQGPQSNISSSPDSPEAMPTSNPLTRMWTLSAINHLNINGSMDHIYG